MTSISRWAALFLVVALIAGACGGDATTTTAESPSGDEATALDATEPEPAVSEAESDLFGEFETLDGSTIDLASLQGEDVVLWFWAPW